MFALKNYHVTSSLCSVTVPSSLDISRVRTLIPLYLDVLEPCSRKSATITSRWRELCVKQLNYWTENVPLRIPSVSAFTTERSTKVASAYKHSQWSVNIVQL